MSEAGKHPRPSFKEALLKAYRAGKAPGPRRQEVTNKEGVELEPGEENQNRQARPDLRNCPCSWAGEDGALG